MRFVKILKNAPQEIKQEAVAALLKVDQQC